MSTQVQPGEFALLSALPEELIVAILCELDVRGLLRCRQVCQSLLAVIDASVELQYKIELAAANMDDGPPGTLVAAARLEMLKTHQGAWNRLAWTAEKSAKLPDVSSWELLGGVFGVVASREHSLHFTQLPSICRGIESRDWTIADMDFRVEDFTFDLSQDLLVVLEAAQTSTEEDCFRIHLRSLSNGQPHFLVPNAAVLSLVPAVITGQIDEWSYTIQIFGDLLGFMLRSFDGTCSSELVVWNWTTGAVEKAFWASDACLQGYSFLSDRLILLGVVCHASPSLRLVVIELNYPSSEFEDISGTEFLCSFSYPLLSPSAVDLQVSIRTEYSPSTSSPGLPFTTSQNDRLLVITTKSATIDQSIVLCVPLSTLLASVDTLGHHDYRVVFPWAIWGPRGTRMFVLNPSDVWFCYVHGMMFVSPRHDTTGFELYDFNRYAVQRGISSGDTKDDFIKFLTQQTTCGGDGKMFAQDVTTSLSCRVTPVPMLPGHSSYADIMLSEDALILISRDNVHRLVLSF